MLYAWHAKGPSFSPWHLEGDVQDLSLIGPRTAVDNTDPDGPLMT